MKNCAATLLIMTLLATSAAGGDGSIRKAHQPLPGRYIVVLNNNIIDEVEYIVDDQPNVPTPSSRSNTTR